MPNRVAVEYVAFPPKAVGEVSAAEKRPKHFTASSLEEAADQVPVGWKLFGHIPLIPLEPPHGLRDR